MLHYSEQWNSDFTRSQLSDPKSKSVGNIRISLRSMCLRTKMYSGDWIVETCLLYTSPSPRDRQKSRMPSSA